MKAPERRLEILKSLCRRRYDNFENLANEFGVCTRTIQRDIEVLSRTEPIYTLSGRYSGGVYVVDGYSYDKIYMKKQELDVLKKLRAAADKHEKLLTYEEKEILASIISEYTKPYKQKGLKNE